MTVAEKTKLLKLDLGAGQHPTEGFEGVDLKEGSDHEVDLFAFPWPFANNSVKEVVSNHLVEHIPHYRPEYLGRDGWDLFFSELYRICKKGAKVTITHPYCKSDRAFWDPTHTRYIHEVTWYYLDKNWREMQNLEHYFGDYDFEVVVISGTGMETNIAQRSHEHQAFARNHYWNTIPDLLVELKKR